MLTTGAGQELEQIALGMVDLCSTLSETQLGGLNGLCSEPSTSFLIHISDTGGTINHGAFRWLGLPPSMAEHG